MVRRETVRDDRSRLHDQLVDDLMHAAPHRGGMEATRQPTMQTARTLRPGRIALSTLSLVAFAMELDVDLFQLNISTPYPGTALFKEALLGSINGLAIGLIVAVVSYFWKGSLLLGAIVGVVIAFAALSAPSGKDTQGHLRSIAWDTDNASSSPSVMTRCFPPFFHSHCPYSGLSFFAPNVGNVLPGSRSFCAMMRPVASLMLAMWHGLPWYVPVW